MGIYNCASTLQEALDSLYAQTYQDFEIILCEDGSKDNTYEIALENQKQHDNIVLLRNPHNMGLNQTLNNCLAVAKGEYIAFVDSDDWISVHYIEQLYNAACHYNAHESFVKTLAEICPHIEVLEQYKGSNIPRLITITFNKKNVR